MSILVTGGAGYIGSHTVVELLNNDKDVIVIDNFSNSKPEVLRKIKEITRKDFQFYEVDLLDYDSLDKIFRINEIDSVIHFAGLKAVGESVKKPLNYYENNVSGTINLLNIMKKYECKKIIFSSSATVYGEHNQVPYNEEMEIRHATNPYGETKIIIENILKDLYNSDNEWNICLLRYFNPIGAHESGLIGENPNGIPNNLMPFILKVANKEIDHLNIFGNDYDTPDGTGVRDYIHVVDLAKAHVKSLEKSGFNIYNLGTGNGYSVLELVNTFKEVNNIDVPYEIAPRRNGDIATCYANPTKANKELNWIAEKGIKEMCKDSWNFIINQK